MLQINKSKFEIFKSEFKKMFDNIPEPSPKKIGFNS